MTRPVPPLIDTQRMRLLMKVDRPWPWCQAEHFRQRREAADQQRRGGPAAAGEPDPWEPVERFDVARNQVVVEGEQQDLSRMVLLCDAGTGKTTTLVWMHYLLNRPESDAICFLFAASEFEQLGGTVDLERFLVELLLPRFRGPTANEHLSPERAVAILKRLRDRGKIVILIDALDQTRGDAKIGPWLKQLATAPQWKTCRIVVSARPHALERFRSETTQPHDLFSDGELARIGWRFVQIEEFTRDEDLTDADKCAGRRSELRTYLGQTENGRDRYDVLPRDALQICSVPRVAFYLAAKLTDDELREITTPSHVYWYALRRMIREGLGSDNARLFGLPAGWPPSPKIDDEQVDMALDVLAAMAFTMTSQQVAEKPRLDDPPDQPPRMVPNFDRIDTPQGYRAFRREVFERVKAPYYGDSNFLLFRQHLKCLRTMNETLSYGILDSPQLNPILWRNRSLQEFLTAYYLANFATADDAGRLGDWIYQPHVPATGAYYWVWRFATEMPPAACEPAAWVRSMAPLFLPGDGTKAGTKRSCEMIYRAWEAMEAYAAVPATGARQVLDKFLGEFESIRRGKKSARQQRAQQFVDRFITIESGWFQMGSDPSNKARYLAEPECVWTQVESFQLNEFPTLNAWYRLFDPGHGQDAQRTYPNVFDRTYASLSGGTTTPVIFTSWYDAWVFCQWARWDGRSCRLPEEQEFEYAAKGCRHTARGGHNCEKCLQDYWWGEKFDAQYCTANQDWKTASTTPLPVDLRRDESHPHRNPFDLVDILGNVWEWCSDCWTDPYVRGGGLGVSAQVLRGGAWADLPRTARSAFRARFTPTSADGLLGFRVARAAPEKL